MRTFDPSVHHVIANHPAVIRHLGWDPDAQGLLTFCDQIADRERFIFSHSGVRDFVIEELAADPSICPGLAMVFEWTGPGIYQMHTMALPTFRGKAVIQAAKRIIHEVFTRHHADMIWGNTPAENRAARAFNRLVGAQGCGMSGLFGGECEIFRNSRARWLADHWTDASS